MKRTSSIGSHAESTSTGSNSTRTSLCRRDLSSQNIRSKYLQRLGFEQSSDSIPKLLSSSCVTNGSNHSVSNTRCTQHYQYTTSLNDQLQGKIPIPDHEIEIHSPRSVGELPDAEPKPIEIEPTNQKQKRSVSFDEVVLVHAIPNKEAYSDRIRKHIWTEPLEMAINATRNAVEFASENWDWRQVAIDDEFYVCPRTGEKIHPCHAAPLSPMYMSVHRPLNRNPFFEKSREAAREWQEHSGTFNTHSYR